MTWLSFLTLGVDRIRHRLLDPATLRLLEGLVGILLCGFALRLGSSRLG